MSIMNLPNAPEPTWIKNNAKSFRQNSSNPKMNSDSLYTQIGESLLKYLWTDCKWKEYFKQKDIKGQKFQKIMSKTDIKGWLRDRKSWVESIDEIIDWTKPQRLFWIER